MVAEHAGDEFFADLAETLGHRESSISTSMSRSTPWTSSGTGAWPSSRVAATFTGPFVIDEEVAVEPNSHQLVLGAAVVADFDGDKIKAVHASFDDATLLEQMLAD